MGGLWVAVLLISDRTANKISNLHHVEPNAVREALLCRANLVFTWNDDPERGLRAIVNIEIDGVRALAVLYPAGDDVYHLGSAYPL